MSNTNPQTRNDIPFHCSPVLYFARCGCTYYYASPHQIPKDYERDPLNDKVCQVTIPQNINGEGDGKLMMARKEHIHGNCRLHDVMMVDDIILKDWRCDDSIDQYSVRDDSCQLRMVRMETAAKYRVMAYLNTKWTIQVGDVIDVTRPIDVVTIQLAVGDEVTEEERRRFHGVSILAWIDLSRVHGSGRIDSPGIDLAEMGPL